MKGRVQPHVAMCATKSCDEVLLSGRGRRPVFCRGCWSRLPKARRDAVNQADTSLKMRVAIREACEVLEGSQGGLLPSGPRSVSPAEGEATTGWGGRDVPESFR